MVTTTYRSSISTAYLEQQPELLFGFAYRLCESGGMERLGGSASNLSLSLRSKSLDYEEPGANLCDGDKQIQRNGKDVATWHSNGINAAVMMFAAGTVANDGSPSPRSNRRCWSHGGRGSP
jgi:hypothetical protein